MTRPDHQTVAQAKRDPAVFARHLIGQELWPHQLAIVRSEARIRVAITGRQSGKSTALATEALWRGFVQAGAQILIISASDLLSMVTALAQAPWLGSSIVDENLSQVTLSNGSVIKSVPASIKQVRGKAIDLLVIDEACFVAEEIWQAAQFTVIARPGSRILMASTPWGRPDRFCAVAYRAGQAGTEGYQSFH